MKGGRLRLVPSHLPEIRDRLAEAARAELEESREGSEPWVRVMLRRAWSAADALAAAPCWWVSSDMEALAVEASRDVPAEVVPQTSSGLLAFERDLPEDVTEGLPHSVRAVHWTAAETTRGDEKGLSVVLSYYTADRSAPRRGVDARVPLVPIGLVGDGPAGVKDVMRAVWALSSEERVCDLRDVRPARAASGAGSPPPDPMARTVKVLVLREPPRGGSDGGEAPAGGRYSHRFVVRGFWRNQPCGPGNSERRLTWVRPFVKGPEGAPLIERETVRVWRR